MSNVFVFENLISQSIRRLTRPKFNFEFPTFNLSEEFGQQKKTQTNQSDFPIHMITNQNEIQ